MWRTNALRFGNLARENQDSDQSISEEDEVLEGEQTGNAISLDGPGATKSAMQVLSQLEILRDSNELHSAEKGLILSNKGQGGNHTDNEVEISLVDEGDGSSHYPRIASVTHPNLNEGMVYLPTMASISHSDEEIISDDEKVNPHIYRSARENVDCTWSEASREVEALVCLNENSSCPPTNGVTMKERKSSKGGEGRKKAKPKFIFRLRSRKEDPSTVASDRHERTSLDNSPPRDEIGAAADEDMDEFVCESQLIYHDKEFEQPENRIVPFELAHKHDLKEHSMAEFLYSFEENSNQLQGSSELDIKKRGRRTQMVLKSTFPLGDRNLDEDDSLEALDSGSPFCSDDEENHQPLNLVIPTRTMADQFHEAFGTISVIDERPHVTFPMPLCNGMYGKLQQVMQSEKERDMDYVKSQNAETGFKDEKMCINVRILTRSLEAKLIVCCCTPVEEDKKMKMKGVARTLTIIFNPRICSDVELEVGNLICIRPPWKEVQVKGKDDVIYLCSYFTQIHP